MPPINAATVENDLASKQYHIVFLFIYITFDFTFDHIENKPFDTHATKTLRFLTFSLPRLTSCSSQCETFSGQSVFEPFTIFVNKLL